MKKNKGASAAFALLLALSIKVEATPASTEYVNEHIREAVANLSLQIKALDKQITQSGHQIGEVYQGGLIFWLDDRGQHGLIAALEDANAGEALSWKNGESGEKITNAAANGLGAGANNTRLIISEQTIDQQRGNFAALAAFKYAVTTDGKPCTEAETICYGEWYLPSIYELSLLQKSASTKTNLAATAYWSSTENAVDTAWLYETQSKAQQVSDKGCLALVRAIRAF